MSETVKKGGISVETQNIFPVIKKWLYSDKDIFVRELTSNCCDAITKHRRLVSLSEAKDDGNPYKITVTLDKELETLTFSDNGIGMDEGEVDRYINQIALSGALDFIEKYESASDSTGDGIIGHFGLGFYSAFMIADKVEIISKSWKDEKAVHWTGNDEGEYEMREGERNERGTDVILHINSDEKEYASGAKIREILEKFCAFMPYEIYFEDGSEKSDGKDEKEEKKPINDTNPLWTKRPSECTKEEYSEFYKKVFKDYREPLFYIHINADYPLNFKGILYFPRFESEFANYEGQVKLYYNQVFVADNIKEVIPEYLLLLKGVIDCPELPLNVSRSYLQTNGYVNKISAHIVKKVSDKINSMFANDRENYEKIWEDLRLFVEYGCLKDEKFFSKVKDSIIYKTTENKFLTAAEYAKTENFDKKIYYTDDKKQQSAYISMFTSQNIPVVEFDKLIDVQFASAVERADYGEELKDVKFVRVDSTLGNIIKEEKSEDGDEYKDLEKFFEETLAKGEGLKIKAQALKDGKNPALLNVSEESRRISDMMRMYGGSFDAGTFPVETTLVLNTSNSLMKKLLSAVKEGKTDDTSKQVAKQIYMHALVALRPLEPDELEELIDGTAALFEKI
ncbi:MAG: molecular chaperone HtpG [Clostridia bacterium]|nr:molecular chaperone HtpG [Clostridia bacterium]